MTAIRNRIGTYGFILAICGCASAADRRDDKALNAVKDELAASACEGSQPQIREIKSERYISYYATIVTACDGMPHEEYELRGFVFDRHSLSRVNDDEVVSGAEMKQGLEKLGELQKVRAAGLGFMCELEFSSNREMYVLENGNPVLLLNYPYPNQACSVAYNIATQDATYPFE